MIHLRCAIRWAVKMWPTPRGFNGAALRCVQLASLTQTNFLFIVILVSNLQDVAALPNARALCIQNKAGASHRVA